MALMIFCILGFICGFGVGIITLNKSIYVRMQQLQYKYELLLSCVKSYAKIKPVRVVNYYTDKLNKEPSDIGCNARQTLCEIKESEE